MSYPRLFEKIKSQALLFFTYLFWSHGIKLILPIFKKKTERLIHHNFFKTERSVLFIDLLDWNYPVRHRPNHLARALSRYGITVLHLSPTDGISRVITLKKAQDNLFITRQLDSAFNAFLGDFVYITSTNAKLLPQTIEWTLKNNRHLIYDYLDFPDPILGKGSVNHAFLNSHRKILRGELPSSVIASASMLFEEVARLRKHGIRLVTNGVDLTHFTQQNKFQPNENLKKILLKNKPVIGYFGALASWLDRKLLQEVAQLRPDYQFILMGALYDNSPMQPIERINNLHVLGQVRYESLPAQMAACDVLIIPFLLNKITEAASPLKLFEYMAIGRPIVSTPIRESKKYNAVLLGKECSEFSQAIDRAIALRRDEKYLLQLSACAQENSWDKKAADIVDLIGCVPHRRFMEEAT